VWFLGGRSVSKTVGATPPEIPSLQFQPKCGKKGMLGKRNKRLPCPRPVLGFFPYCPPFHSRGLSALVHRGRSCDCGQSSLRLYSPFLHVFGSLETSLQAAYVFPSGGGKEFSWHHPRRWFATCPCFSEINNPVFPWMTAPGQTWGLFSGLRWPRQWRKREASGPKGPLE